VDGETLNILIRTLCSATPDRWRLEVAQRCTMRPNGKVEALLEALSVRPRAREDGQHLPTAPRRLGNPAHWGRGDPEI